VCLKEDGDSASLGDPTPPVGKDVSDNLFNPQYRQSFYEIPAIRGACVPKAFRKKINKNFLTLYTNTPNI